MPRWSSSLSHFDRRAPSGIVKSALLALPASLFPEEMWVAGEVRTWE
jgi:hypothetical protein